MRIRLTHKLFGAFLLTSFMIVALMVGIMRFYVERNFIEYVNKVELEKLDSIVDALSEEYRLQESWDNLRGNPRRWWKIIRLAEPEVDTNEPEPPAGPEEFDGTEPFPVPHEGKRPGRRMFGPGDRPLARHGGPFRILRRVSLFDSANQHVAGAPGGDSSGLHTLREITVDGETVGWLALRKHPRPPNPLASRFLKQQHEAFYLTGGGILLLAALVSFLFARHLLAPIRKLTEGTRALTSLKFDTRIPVSSRDELGQLAVDFNVMAQTLEKYERMRKQWISDISHELRTPLAILRGEIEAMQDGVREVSPQALDSLHAEVLHVGKIVNDLHELSLEDSRALHSSREPVDPVDVLRSTLKLFETRLNAAQIEIRDELGTGPGIALKGNADRLAQLYSNLLENTLKYTDAPGTLRIWLDSKRDRLVLNFEDSGPGVPEASLDRLFDRLYRVDSARTRGKGGSGLGLAICKAIVENHGGKISAANAPSGGLRIEIDLPLDANPTTPG